MTEQQIIEAIDVAVKDCDYLAMPLVCKKTETEQGMNYLRSRVIHMMIVDGFDSVEECLPHIEQELDGM